MGLVGLGWITKTGPMATSGFRTGLSPLRGLGAIPSEALLESIPIELAYIPSRPHGWPL